MSLNFLFHEYHSNEHLNIITDADVVASVYLSSASVILCVILSVCLSVYPHNKTETAETKIAKLALPSRPSISIRSKGQRSRSRGHKVHNIATRQPCGTVSLLLCRHATRRSRMVVSSRDDNRAGLCYWRRSSGRRQLCTLSSAEPLVKYIFSFMPQCYLLIVI